MSDCLNPDSETWQRKAVAFVTRSHRHLWGKNNEAPQAFLFRQGLRNAFMKEMLIGWNKFAQERPLENWGFETERDKKLFLPAGIVIPCIREKDLISVFIQPFDEGDASLGNMKNKLEDNTRDTMGASAGREKVCPEAVSQDVTVPRIETGCTRLSGSREPVLILGKRGNKTAVTRDMFLGLYLFQETREDLCVLVVPDASAEPAAQKALDPSKKIFVFSGDEKEDALNQNAFAGISRSRFFQGLTREEAALKCLSG